VIARPRAAGAVSVNVMRRGLACALTLLALVPSLAGAGPLGFGAPLTIGSRPYPGGTLAAAIDPAGDWIVAWQSAAGLEVSRGDAAGHFSSPQLLATRVVPSQVELSMAPDGSAAIQWAQSITQPQDVATAPPGGPFGAPAPSRATAVLAVDGRVIAIWDRGVARGHGKISYAIAPQGGRLGAPRPLAAPTSALLPSLIAHPALGVDARGDVVMDYLTGPSMSPPRNSQFAGAVMAAGANAFGDPAIVSGPLRRGESVELPATLAATTLFSGPGGAAGSFILGTPTAWRLDVVAAGASFGAPVNAGSLAIPTRSGETLAIGGPVVALPAAGGEVAAWTRVPTAAESGPPPSEGDVLAAVAPAPGAPFGATRTLAAPTQWPRDLLAGATSDLSIVLWTTLAGAPGYDRETLECVLHGPAGFTPARVLGANPLRPTTFAPDPIELAAAGSHAIVAWGARTSVEVALLSG